MDTAFWVLGFCWIIYIWGLGRLAHKTLFPGLLVFHKRLSQKVGTDWVCCCPQILRAVMSWVRCIHWGHTVDPGHLSTQHSKKMAAPTVAASRLLAVRTRPDETPLLSTSQSLQAKPVNNISALVICSSMGYLIPSFITRFYLYIHMSKYKATIKS